MYDLSIIIINYNGLKFIDRCIESIFSYMAPPAGSGINPSLIYPEIIIVDNASTDGSAGFIENKIKTYGDKLKLIKCSKNLGFSKASNTGAKSAKGRFLLFLNPDTEIIQHGIEKVIEFYKTISCSPKAGAVGVKTINEDGSIQYSCRSFPTIARQLYESFFLYRLFAKNRVFGSYFMTYFDHKNTREVDWVSGSFMLIEKDIFYGVGGFDEDYFIYSEDTQICLDFSRKGFKNYYYAEYCIRHNDAGIASADMAMRNLHIWHSRRLYFKKNYTNAHAKAFSIIYFFHIFLRMLIFYLIYATRFNNKSLRKTARDYKKTLKLFFKKQLPGNG